MGQFVGEALSAWRRVSWILGFLLSNELYKCVEQTIGAIGNGIGGIGSVERRIGKERWGVHTWRRDLL